VPAAVWSRDYTRPIAGRLPPELEAVLDGATRRILRTTGAVAISAAVAVPGQGLWSATRGVSARTTPPQPLPQPALFQVASVSKAFTAALILQLVQAGRLQLDAPVAAWFPQVQHAEHITIRQLLTHTSGIATFNAFDYFDGIVHGHKPPDALIDLAIEKGPRFCPGADWAYSNTGYVMLGRILEVEYGAPLHEVLAEHVTGPLGLRHTLLRRPDDGVTGVVRGHQWGMPIDGVEYATPFGAGAAASTARDLVLFWHALLSGALLRPETVRMMFREMYPMPGTPMWYGLGVQLYEIPEGGGLMLGHSGGVAGFTAVVGYVVPDDLYVAVAFNDKSVPAEAGLWTLVQAVREYRDGKRTPDGSRASRR
jgi:D-alanyl-D-alanine carboxypeptidase